MSNSYALSYEESHLSTVEISQTEEKKTKAYQPNSDKQQQQPAQTVADKEEDVQCDWIVCSPSSCQPLATPACLLLWLCLCSFAQGMLLNGFLNSVLTSIERRFELQSVQTGMISSTYDMGACMAIIPITYFGRSHRRSRFIAIGVLIVGLGSFVFALPHFLAGNYSYQPAVQPLCYAEGKDYPDACLRQSQSYYRWLFWLAQLLHGIGAAPFFTLAVAFLDDNLSVMQSGVYLGIYYLIGLAGPASGYLLGGQLLNVFVDIGVEPIGLTPQNTSQWVGAWWIGFLISGSISLTAVLPMFGFPRSFRGSAKARAERSDESHGSSSQRSAKLQATLRDLLPSMRLLLSIPTFLCLTLAGTAASLLITALATFGPKLMQHFFHLNASAATMSIGLVSVPCGAVGLLAGAATLRCLQLPLAKLLWIMACSSAIAMALVSTFFVRCEPQRFAGVNKPYPQQPLQQLQLQPNFTAACNANCNCVSSSSMFSPICDAAGIVHFSACYAGCSNATFEFKKTKYYTDCACVNASFTVNGRQAAAVDGLCQWRSSSSSNSSSSSSSNCHSAPLFLTLLGFFMFFMFFITIPTLQATIRVIPSDLKDFGIGMQIVIMRLLGSVPAPLMLGKLIDSTCSLWTGGCSDNLGACITYNTQQLWLLVLLFIAGLKLIEFLLFCSAALLYKPPAEVAAAAVEAAAATNQLPEQKQSNVFVVKFQRGTCDN